MAFSMLPCWRRWNSPRRNRYLAFSTTDMRYLSLIIFLTLALTACTSEEIKETKEIEIEKIIDADAEPGLVHSVYFWLNDDVDEAGHQAFRDAVMELEAISTVQRMFVGPAADTNEPGITDNTFDLALIVWYKNRADYDAYQTDPLHTAFVESQKAKFKQVKVMDNNLY